MGHGWIVAVLADLRTYAQANDLPRLAAALADAEGVAEGEVATGVGGTPGRARGDGAGPGTRSGAAGKGAQPP